jgi:hypothetical protein
MRKPVWVVSHPDVRPMLHAWAQARAMQGFDVSWLSPLEVTQLQKAPASHVLLVGHPRGEGPLALAGVTHDPPYRHMATPFHGDHALVHGSLEAWPRHAVGRLPARTLPVLAALLEKTLAAPPATPPVVHFVDGHPQWQWAINLASHAVAALAARHTLPAGITAQRFSFNPFASATLRGDLQAALHSGGRVLVYVGHGQQDHVDGIHVDTLPQDGGGHVLAVLACCHAGVLDVEEPGLAERWLLRPRGPRAILAASNVSDPRLNPAMALAFVDAALQGGVVGDALHASRQALLGAATGAVFAALRLAAPQTLRRAHVGIYNLLGDPTLPL